MGDFMNENGLRAVTDTRKYMFSNERSEVLARCGLSASATEYAKDLHYNNFNYPYFAYSDTDIGFISVYGQYTSLDDLDYSKRHSIGIRPILDYSYIDLPNDRLEKSGGFLKFKYGSLPTERVSYPGIIEEYLNTNQLSFTNNYYTRANLKYDKLYNSEKLMEYYDESQNKEYIRISDDNKSFEWFSVEPLYWYVDKENKLLISDRILFSIVLTHNISSDKIVEYINEHFLKEIAYNETIKLSRSKGVTVIIPKKHEFKPRKPIELNEINNYDAQLARFMNLPPEPLDMTMQGAMVYGQALAEHAKAISDASFYIMDTIKTDNDSMEEIRDELSGLNKRRASIFSKPYKAEQIAQNNKQILKNMEQFLIEQQKVMVEHLNIFDYDKKLIAHFVERLNTYISVIENCLINPQNIDNLNQFERSDYEDVKDLLEEKLYDYRDAINVHTTQYEQISQLSKNYAIYLQQIMSFHLTKFPSLCTAAAIASSILFQKESKASINEINMLLKDIIKSNNEYLTNNKKIENLDESVHNMLVNESLIEASSTEQKLETSSDKILTKK